MPCVPTVIKDAVGEKTLVMGKPVPAKNNPDDVKKIQALLKKVLGPSAPIFTDGKCDATMKGAIAEFQRAWGGGADSTVEPLSHPHAHTLKNLDRLANPLVLNQIAKCKVAVGGYVIGYETCDRGPLPPAGKGYTLHLGFPAEANSIEVTGRPHNDLLSYQHNLGKVLAIFEKLACWATPVQCQLYLKYKGAVISTSNAQPLEDNAPVQPHNGRMLPLDEVNNGPKLSYQGDVSAKQFWGRMFAQVPGYNKCVFVYGGEFESDNSFRGFDCITYAGTTCGASNLHMAGSPDLAESLHATAIDHIHVVVKDPKGGKETLNHAHAKDPKTGKEIGVTVQLEDADHACVKDFFAATPTGYFLLFSSGHIVIVANGEVHEFTPPSYRCTKKVTEWLELSIHKAQKFTVRRLPQKPARAV